MRTSAVLLLSAFAACGVPEQDPFEPWTLEELSAEQGFSIRTDEFQLPAGGEDQSCYFLRVPDINNGQPFYVSRVHMAINPGSHHMNVFRVKTIVPKDPAKPAQGMAPEDGEPIVLGPNGQYQATVVRGYDDFFGNPCWNSANWADWPLIANSQNSEPDNPYTNWQLPENVGIRLDPGEMLMVQTHYVNFGAQQTTHGTKVGINLHRFPSSAVPLEMSSLFATQQSIRVCRSNPSATFSGTCRFPSGQVTINAANGHFHSRGKKFTVYSWDGISETQPPDSAHFYTSNNWNDPPMITDLDVRPPQGGGVWWNCEYQWIPPTPGTCEEVDAKDQLGQDDCCYTFGGNVDVGEHCNLFLYYYPKVEGTDVFCN
jgi:hypothetical protein